MDVTVSRLQAHAGGVPSETTIQVSVGATVIAEDVNSKAATGTTKAVITFIVPAGKKWKVPANAGITLIKSSYLAI